MTMVPYRYSSGGLPLVLVIIIIAAATATAYAAAAVDASATTTTTTTTRAAIRGDDGIRRRNGNDDDLRRRNENDGGRGRSLSETVLAGYEPLTDVTDHARIDRDQMAVEQYLEGETGQSFAYAKDVYEKGAFSKSVATLALTDSRGLTIALKKGRPVAGKNAAGNEIALAAYQDYEPGAKEVLLQYVSEGCYVGGLARPDTISQPLDLSMSGDQFWDGCTYYYCPYSSLL